MKKLIIFTDGGVRNNGNAMNIGSWAFTMTISNVEIYEYAVELNTESQIQEMKACIAALNFINDYDIPIEIHSDSSYVVNCFNNCLRRWKTNNWSRGKYNPKPLFYLDLWKELDKISQKFSNLRFVKVKAHSDNKGNNRADELVNIAIDEYLNQQKTKEILL